MILTNAIIAVEEQISIIDCNIGDLLDQKDALED